MKTKMLFAALAGAGLIAAGPAMAQETLTVWWAKGFYKGEDDAFLAAVKAFEAKYPKIKVELSLYAPQEGIRHILRGWGAEGAPAIHDLTVQDVRVRNIPTNTRAWDENGTRRFGNSIFVFEIAGLCIAHLGHLHHTLTVQQLAQIGQMDVVLVPVDGSYTLDIDGMVEVLKALKAPLIVPMHYFSRFTLERFLSAARPHFEVVESPVPTTVLSRDVLPLRQRVLVLPGE